MSYVIQRVVWYNWYSRFDDTDTVDVVLDTVGQMADIMFVLPCVWCHIFEFISDIMELISWIKYMWCHKNVVWCHIMWTWSFIECIWYYTYSGCDVLYTKGVISLKVCVWWHTFSAVMSYTMDMMSSYMAGEISKIQLVWYHQYIGCDDTDTVDMLSNIVGVMS